MGDNPTPMDESDYKWLTFNSRNWAFLEEGRNIWWRRGPYDSVHNGEVRRHNPKWHVLTLVDATGENNDAVYEAKCGYRYKFSRILLERPRVVKRKPLQADLCQKCIRS